MTKILFNPLFMAGNEGALLQTVLETLNPFFFHTHRPYPS